MKNYNNLKERTTDTVPFMKGKELSARVEMLFTKTNWKVVRIKISKYIKRD